MIKILIALPLALLAAGSVEAGRAEREAREVARLEKALAGKVAGKPLNCIRLRDIQGPESFGDSTLLFRVSRNLVYRTETSGSCDRVGRGNALVTKTWSSDLCRGDIAQSADLLSGFTSGHCAMGTFVPYKGS